MKPTQDTYTQLDKAYAHFNRTLFGGRLPTCLITLLSHPDSRRAGYFWNDRFLEAEGPSTTDEIALNPVHFRTHKLSDALSTLVHEMTHQEQQHFGKPSRNGYHNREWVRLMELVGLIPSNTGMPGGKQTGQKMDHYIQVGGRFDKACAKLLATGFTIPWHARSETPLATAKRASKTKYVCPSCGANAWAKPKARLICGNCEEAMGEG